MKKPRKAKRAEPTVEPEKTSPAEEQAPQESSREDPVVRGGATGAVVGGLVGGASGAAVGGIFGLIAGELGDDKKSWW
jgi:predicted lipid-binding transport protein (Tim44 family)